MPLARQVVWLEPVSAMLTHRQNVAPQARFVIGQAERLPFAPRSFDLDVRELPLAAYGLRLLDFTDVEARLPMTFDAYLRYMLSETNVEDAIARGACSAEEARDWCRETLRPVFADGEVTVVIPGYIATLAPAPSKGRGEG